MAEGIYVIDPQTHESVLIPYDEIDPDVFGKALVPVGGFCYKASDFLHLPLAKVPFYIDGWLPKQGKALFYGQAKVGKSMLAMQLADCIGQGKPFLGIPTRQGSVLYIQFELGHEALQDRMATTKRAYDNVFVGTSFSMKLDKQSGKDQLNVALNEIKPDVCILDPMYKTMTGDENVSHDVAQVFDYLDEMAQAYLTSFIVFHHAGRDLSKGARGSTTFSDWVDTEVEIKKVSSNGQPLRVEICPKYQRHAAIPPDSIFATLQDMEFVRDEESKAVNNKSALLQFLKDNDCDHKADDLIGRFGSRKTIYDWLAEWGTGGLVYRVKRGVYRFGKDPLLLETGNGK